MAGVHWQLVADLEQREKELLGLVYDKRLRDSEVRRTGVRQTQIVHSEVVSSDLQRDLAWIRMRQLESNSTQPPRIRLRLRFPAH